MSDLARSAIELMVQRSGETHFERDVAERLQHLEDSVKQIRAAMNTARWELSIQTPPEPRGQI
jgi:hypothetical protein